jgi:putative nucleotidyltransferase with HDIG domain
LIERKDIEDTFGEFLGMIGDSTVEEAVIKAWLLGCERGGWSSMDQLWNMPFSLLTDCKSVSFIEHCLAVTGGALHMAQAQEKFYKALPYKINYDRLIAGGLLHDVGKLLEIEPDGQGGYRKSYSGKCERHPISGALLVAEVGLPQEYVNVVACHAKEGDGRPQVIETVFVHQADFATFNPLVMSKKGDLIQ